MEEHGILTRSARLVVAAALAAALAAPARAQNGSGSYGAAFLKIPVGARLVSSPDVVAGMQPDASLLHSNPAFIAGLEHTGLFASSSRWLDDLSFSAVGAALPLGGGGTVLGVGASLLYSGGLDGYDPSLNVVSEESFYDLGLDVTVARRFGESGFALATGATYLREHVVPEDGNGWAFHLGGSYRRGPYLVHAAGRDLGASVSFPSGSWAVAQEWSGGVARAFNTGAGLFVAGIQASQSDAYGERVRLGIDYTLNHMFTLHTALNDNLNEFQPDSRLNAGFGVRFGALSMEYAYAPSDYFASAHTFSLGYSFGGGAMRSTGAFVPDGDLAPPIPDTPQVKRRLVGEDAPEYVLVAGAHGTVESAQSEARALEQLNIPCEVASEGPRFRVIVGRYSTFDGAAVARQRYRAKGHEFQILAR
jgi:hypothetical protein